MTTLHRAAAALLSSAKAWVQLALLGQSYERKLVAVLVAIFAYAVAIAAGAFWTSSRLAYVVERGHLAQQVLTSYLRLSSDTQELYRVIDVRGRAAIAGAPGSTTLAADTDLIRQIQDHISKLRKAITDEIAFVGADPEENEEEEFQRFAFIARRIAVFARDYQLAKAVIDGDQPQLGWQRLAVALDESLDRDFRAALKAGVQDELDEVDRNEVRSRELISFTRTLTFTSTGLATAFIVLVGTLLLRDLRQRVRALHQAAIAFAGGDLKHRINVVGGDEFARLSHSFNEMAAEIDARRRASSDNETRLTQAVAERTAELRHLNEQLSAADARRRQFLADISHELRTPLTIIRGESEIMLRGESKATSEYKQALSQILEQARHTARLVDDLLFVARSEAGLARFDFRSVDLAALLAELCQQLRRIALDRGVVIKLDVPQERLLIAADEDKLRQVFLILLDNAIRYSNVNGTIALSIEAATDGLIVRIADDGIGIPAADLPFVFERFYRGRNASTPRAQGVGLGLPLAKAIVVAHAGAIDLKSEPGNGTRVSVHLPTASKTRWSS